MPNKEKSGKCSNRKEEDLKFNRFGKYFRLLAPITGLLALIWFLIRVIPKPSRASYPCQRIAFPLASGFVIWLMGIFGSITAMRKARLNLARSKYLVGAVFLVVSIGFVWAAMSFTSQDNAQARTPQPANSPIGEAKGIHPGRVVWTHDPDATDWDGPGMGDGYWWQGDNTSQAVVDDMVGRSIRALAGRTDINQAWEQIFRYFNRTHGRGDTDYQAGEKITIKVNFVAEIPQYGGQYGDHTNYPMTSPQVMHAVIDHLVNVVGVQQSDITIGETLALFIDDFYNYLASDFPNVHYLDSMGQYGRTQAQLSTAEVNWSTSDADGKLQDYVPVSYAQADYLINIANLKGHYNQGGITLTAKNHYGSLVRIPNTTGYYNLHSGLLNEGEGGIQEMGHYRPLVDLMGHQDIGAKTVLYLIDGLYPCKHAKNWPDLPEKWYTAPFNGDWTSSVFASQDPVAIDSVGFDFLLAEWPEDWGPATEGADDYMHEAALADDPPSGTFYDPEGDGTELTSLGVHEHWNNPVEREYTRNLGTGDGIELVTPINIVIDGDMDYDGDVDENDLAIIAEQWKLQYDWTDLATLVENWLEVAPAIPPVSAFYDGSFQLPWQPETTGGSGNVAYTQAQAPDGTPAAYADVPSGDAWRWTQLRTNGNQVNIGSRQYLEFDIYFDTNTSPGHRLSAIHIEINNAGEWGYKWEDPSVCWVDGAKMTMADGPDDDLEMAGNEWHSFKLDLTTNMDGKTWPQDPNAGMIQLCLGHDAADGIDVYLKNVRFTAGSGNQKPYVNAGSSLSVALPEDTVNLNATVYDDGKTEPPAPLMLTWEQLSGPGTAIFANYHVANTTVTLSEPGTYLLQLTVDDGEFTVSDQVSVTLYDSEYPANSVMVFEEGAFKNNWQQGSNFSIANAPDAESTVSAYCQGNSWKSISPVGEGTYIGDCNNFEFDVYFDTDTSPGSIISIVGLEIDGADWTYAWEADASIVIIDGQEKNFWSSYVDGNSWHHFRVPLRGNNRQGGSIPSEPQIGYIRFYIDGAEASMYLDNVAFTPDR